MNYHEINNAVAYIHTCMMMITHVPLINGMFTDYLSLIQNKTTTTQLVRVNIRVVSYDPSHIIPFCL